jgi:hypothetical protein
MSTIVFLLGMTLGQARATCPRPLIPVYETRSDYLACDDGKKTTVLAFDAKEKVVGIFDLKWYVQFGRAREQGR